MIDVMHAVSAAKVFVANMFPDAVDIRLEEVELADQPAHWDVVVSFPSGEPKTFATMVNGDRIFKRVVLDADTGDPVALKVFKP